jgi:hypothetical protein
MLLTLGLKLNELGSFSTAAVAAIYYKLYSYFTNESGDRYIENVGSTGTGNDLLLNSGRGIELTTESVTITGDYITWFDFSDNNFHTTTTSKTFTAQTVNNILTHTADWSTADQAAIEANPNLIGKLSLSGTGTIDELDMTLGSGDAWYACMELSGDTLYDSRSTDTAAISDYTAAVRDNADFQTAGIQTTAFQRDALGVPQAYYDTALNFLGDGYGDTQYNITYGENFTIECVVKAPDSTPSSNEFAFGTFDDYFAFLSSGVQRVKIGANLTYDTAIFTSEYVHILYSYTETNVSSYVNGVPALTNDYDSPTTDGKVLIGGRTATITNLPEGFASTEVPLFKVHPTALSATEALEAYNTWLGA